MRRICLLPLLLLAGCSLWPAAPAPVAATPPPDLLRPGDTVHIAVVDEDGLNGDFTIAADGTLRLALLGAVPAAGLTPPALQEDLRQKLAAGYLKTPQVRVVRGGVPASTPPPLRASDL